MNHQQEADGFKLLQEDSIDDRPCPAVKKFVSSVLDRKDMKDQDVAHSYRNLMEYRDSTSSPSACSAGTSSSALDGDRPNSPPSPTSPTTVPGPMDDQRLPNELLDEICEDIGMKEGMELDFVEYLMEQDTNPHMYMTQEAISSGAFSSAARSTPTGSASGSSNSGSHVSNNHNNNNDIIKKRTSPNLPVATTPNFLFKQNFQDSEWLQQLPATVIHSSSGPSSGSTTVQSSENNSPANKRVHLSVSTETSPNKGRSQTPPAFSNNAVRAGAGNHNLFKMPQPGPVMAKRSHSYPQGGPTSSPVQSTSSSSSASSQGSNTSSYSGFSRPQEFATNLSASCHPSDCSDQEDHTASPNNRKNCQSVSPKPSLSSAPSGDFPHRPVSPSQPRGGQDHFCPLTGSVQGRDGSMFRRVGLQSAPQTVSIKSVQPQTHQPHVQQPHTQHPHTQHPHAQQPQTHQPHTQQSHTQQPQTQQPHTQQHNTHHQRWITTAVGQVTTAVGQISQGPAGPFFSKGMYSGGPFQASHQQHIYNHPVMAHGHLVHMARPPDLAHGHLGHMARPADHHQSSVPAPADSPLDQGYFSNESAGNCSNGSAPSPAFTSSSMSSFSSVSTVLPADHSQKQQPPASSGSVMVSGRPPGQKSVHFADMPDGSPPAYPQSCGMETKQSFVSGLGTSSDCAFEMESNGQPKAMPSGKIMPRFHHSMKSGVAPYTVPISQGQVIGPPDYDMSNRPSCAMSVSIERSSPEEYVSKSCHVNGGSSNTFYVNGNQGLMRMDSVQDYPSVPPPLISPHSGDFGNMQPEPPRYAMSQFSSMQQQSSRSHQLSNPSSAESMPPLQPHPHLQQTQHHHHHHEQHQTPPFSSCSYSTQGVASDLAPPHLNSMQISHDISSGSYHVPLAVSTPMSSRVGPNSRFAGPYAGKMCSPTYESSYDAGAHPDMYPSQQPQGSLPTGQASMGNQQPSSASLGWGPEDLRIQVGDMQTPFSPMKGDLHPRHVGNMSINPMKGGLRPHPPQPLPHMQPSPTPACAAPMGSGPHIQDLSVMNSGMHGMGPPHAHMGPPHAHHPEYGPCSGVTCPACKMTQASSSPQSHPHIGPCPSAGCHVCKVNHPCPGPLPTPAVPHVGPCAGPGCTACKINTTNRPQILSSQQKFIQHLIMDEANSAYRSHPLFPLLRDLVIAEMNFDNPRFHYQQLLSLLPNDFHKLLQNFLHRNPPSGHYQSNQAVESVIMDSLRLAHSNLVEKIRHRQEMEKIKANSSASLRSMEEFCQKFDHSVTGPMGRPGANGSVGLCHPMAGYHEESYIQHGVGHVYRSMKDGSDVFLETSVGATSPQTNKTESKKHPSLPKEAVAMMMEWLRNHKDNPYPNDDEKAMLIKQTGLSINQINYWFTNARRRILPKWAQCKS